MNPRQLINLALGAAFALTVFTSPAYADGGVPLWTNLYSGPGNSGNFANAIAADQDGNVFVTGGPMPNVHMTNPAVTVAYSGAGVPLWTNHYYGPGYYTGASGIAVDDNGNVFLTGFVAIDINNGDYATVAYSGSGLPLWTNRYRGPTNGNNSATAIALDRSGRVFVTGGSVARYGSIEYATVAYSSAGIPLWTNVYGTAGPRGTLYDAYAIATDDDGNVFVTGESDGAYGTVAYSGTGVPLWTNRYRPRLMFNARANAIATDKKGKVFVTGYISATDGSFEYATVAYSTAGTALWTNYYQGPGHDDYASGLAVDRNGNLFVAGKSASSNDVQPTYDFAVVAYSGAGVPLWTNRYAAGDRDFDSRVGVAVDSVGKVVVAGGSTADGKAATLAYSGAGVPLWTNHYIRPQSIYTSFSALTVDRQDNIIVAGNSVGTNQLYENFVIKYSSGALQATVQVSPLANFPGIPGFLVIATNNISACVALNGVAADPDHDPLTYLWFHDADLQPFAAGNPATDCLGVGTHTLQLAVSDGRSSAGSATVTVDIISPGAAVGIAIAGVEDSSLSPERQQPLLVSLGAARAAFERGSVEAGINQLAAFQCKVQAQVENSDPVLAQTLSETARIIIEAVGAQ